MAFEGLNFDVGLNARPFTDGIKTMQTQAASFDNTVKQIGHTLMGVFGAVSVVATLKKSIEMWGQQEQAMMKLSIAAQRFTRDAQGTYDRITKLSTNLQHLTGVGNETYQALGALGLSLGIAEEKIENATLAATLLSQVTGMDLNSAMKNLAKTQAGLTGELGEALPFLRELTQEQLRNGEAIDLVIQKYDGFAEQLSETTQVGVKRFWSALGDVGEVLGKTFNPLIQKAANWMEDFSSKIEKPTDILKTLKDTIKAGYEELGPFGKAVVGVGAAFLTLKVAGTAWSLLSQIVVTGGHLIVGVFKTIFSWPTLLIAGLYTLRVAWDHDWLGIRGAVSQAGEAIDGVLKSIGINVENFGENTKKAFGDVKASWEELTKATDVKEFMQGIVDLGSNILQIPAKIVFGENEVESFQSKLLNVITWGGLVFAIPGSHPVLEIAAVLLSLGLTDRYKEELKNTKSALKALQVLAEEVYNSIATIGAGLTELLGGDSQKYLDSTNSALEKMSATIKEIGETESISKKFDLGVELAQEIFEIPAKFLVGGFVDNFDQSWIDNALGMLAVIGITKFLGGSWRLAVGLSLIGDVVLGDDVSSNGLVNSAVKALEAGAATWMITKSGALGLGVALVVGGWEAGKEFGNWLVDAGIGDSWDQWLKDTLGDFYTDTIAGLKTDTFLDQLNVSGIYAGMTILAGLKWPFDKMLDFGAWVWEAVKNTALTIYEAGLEIGNQLLEGIKYIFGFGWLQDLLGLGVNKPSGTTEDPETGRTSGGRESFVPAGGGESLRFKKESMAYPELEGMYAMAGFPISGMEIRRTPLSKEITDMIDRMFASNTISNLKTVIATAEELDAYSGISSDPTSIIAPAMKELTFDLINALNQSLLDPTIVASLAYAESKYLIGAKGGEGRGAFQFEPIGIEQAKKWFPTNWDYETAATDTVYSTMAAEKTLDWLVDSFGSLRDAIIAWNRGFGNAQNWIAGGEDLSTLPDATKILLTNFMVEFENLINGDWSSLNGELLAHIAEVADAVNFFVESTPEVIARSFVGDPKTFDVMTTTTITEEQATTQKETVVTLENLFTEAQTANSYLNAIANRLTGIRDLLWQRLPVTAGMASGGYISGAGGPTDDLIPALLSNGEFVVNAKSTEKWLPFLKAINAQGFADGGIARFATGTATKIDVGSIGGGPLTWWDTILSTLMSVVGDYAETAKKDFGMIKNVLGDLLRTIGLDVDAPLDNLNKLQSELDGLTLSTSNTGDTVEDFMTAMFKGYSKINRISEVLSEGKIENVNRQLAFLDTAMNDLEKQFMEGTIQLGEYTERMTYLKNLTDSFSDTLGDLKKKIERSSIVGDSSEIFKVDENTGELVSVFAKLRPGMEGLTDVVGNLATAGEMFAMSLLNQVVNLEAINMLLNPITTILTGVMEILGPIINLLKPLGDALISIGRVFALTFNLFGQGLLVLQPFFKALGWLGATISYIADQLVLFVDGIFVWLSGLPLIGGQFSPLLTEDQRANMGRSISERMEDYELPQSSTGQTFQAGSSQHITNNYHFEFRDNDILTEDDESARRFADLIYKNLRDRGVELQVG
ncbi:MAG: transglycosylase SLT domain-containing protein [Synergistaceae bacterium]|jgi:hypothetical protein